MWGSFFYIDKDAKEAKKRRIFDPGLARHTQQEIAEEVRLPGLGCPAPHMQNVGAIGSPDLP